MNPKLRMLLKKPRSTIKPYRCLNNMEIEPVIWLEDHARLKTMTKIFYSCSTEIGAPPNTHTCPKRESISFNLIKRPSLFFVRA
jgi:hypothetical protein